MLLIVDFGLPIADCGRHWGAAVLLATQRREHLEMWTIIGDPAMRLASCSFHNPAPEDGRTPEKGGRRLQKWCKSGAETCKSSAFARDCPPFFTGAGKRAVSEYRRVGVSATRVPRSVRKPFFASWTQFGRFPSAFSRFRSLGGGGALEVQGFRFKVQSYGRHECAGPEAGAPGKAPDPPSSEALWRGADWRSPRRWCAERCIARDRTTKPIREFCLLNRQGCGRFYFARAHGMWTYESRQGRNAATAVCSASAVVTLALLNFECETRSAELTQTQRGFIFRTPSSELRI